MSPYVNSETQAYDGATRLLAQSHFHQSIWVPQTSLHGRLRVTFATTSNFDQHGLPVVLFHGPMFGSRYHIVTFDKLARETGVRIVYIDRPGFGGSTPVPLKQRVPIWLETVPLVLQRLNVKHVALCSHSAGTTYALNTLLQLRDILSPTAPYIALLAPWVHSEHSKMALTTVLSKLPTGMLSSWSGIVQFINLRVGPTVSWSGGIFSTVSNLFKAEPPSADTGIRERFGDEKTGNEIEKLQVKYMFEEGMTGANDEARLCLKSDGDGMMGAYENCERYVEVFCAQEKERRELNRSGGKLQVSLHYAESDVMIGKGGQEYFEKCWTQSAVKEAIAVHSAEHPGTNHDSVLVDLQKGPMRSILGAIASAQQ